MLSAGRALLRLQHISCWSRFDCLASSPHDFSPGDAVMLVAALLLSAPPRSGEPPPCALTGGIILLHCSALGGEDGVETKAARQNVATCAALPMLGRLRISGFGSSPCVVIRYGQHFGGADKVGCHQRFQWKLCHLLSSLVCVGSSGRT